MIDPHKITDKVRQFITTHEGGDIPSLVLKHKSVDGVSISDIADQLNGRRRARTKFPTLYHHPDIVYPPAVNVEQASSEVTASYKAGLLSTLPAHEVIADLTGGFGIDTFAFSKSFQRVIHVEPDADLQQLVRYNHEHLGCTNVEYVNSTAEQFLTNSPRLSAIYVDPSRRKMEWKVYSFRDCVPDMTSLQHAAWRVADTLLVKASPMHDIQLALRELDHVRRTIVLAVDNEVRELLVLAERNEELPCVITATNIMNGHNDDFDFQLDQELLADAPFGVPDLYLYEPNAAILKAGAFKLVAQRYGLTKLHVNTHLYTHPEVIRNFPGRIFRVIATPKAEEKSVRQSLPDGKANIIVRNYPATPEQLKKKLRLSDGGDLYLLAFTASDGPALVAAERLA